MCIRDSSPTFTITSTGGLFSHPDYPGVTVTIPENAVAPESPSTLELKVGVIKKVHFFSYIKTVLICGQIKSAPRLFKVIRFPKNGNLIITSLVNLTEKSFTEYLERSFCYLTFGEPTSILRPKEYMKLTADDYSFEWYRCKKFQMKNLKGKMYFLDLFCELNALGLSSSLDLLLFSYQFLFETDRTLNQIPLHAVLESCF